jgi:hypothetical protein
VIPINYVIYGLGFVAGYIFADEIAAAVEGGYQWAATTLTDFWAAPSEFAAVNTSSFEPSLVAFFLVVLSPDVVPGPLSPGAWSLAASYQAARASSAQYHPMFPWPATFTVQTGTGLTGIVWRNSVPNPSSLVAGQLEFVVNGTDVNLAGPITMQTAEFLALYHMGYSSLAYDWGWMIGDPPVQEDYFYQVAYNGNANLYYDLYDGLVDYPATGLDVACF